ncbi:MAG: DNA gyrase C-terminal beta-propeller domain-containing protein [Anaerolineae bacterium]
MARIAYLEDLLASPHKILGVIREDIAEVSEKYGDERRTEMIYGVSTEFNEADLVRDEEVAILLSRYGYIKRVPSTAYRSQRRGGKGVTGMITKEEDGLVEIVTANSLDTVLFFTDWGRVYSERAYAIPEATRAGKGTMIQSILALNADEHVTAIVPVSSFENNGYFVLATKFGRIKRVDLEDFAAVRPSGLIAMSLDEGDTLNWAKPTNGDQHVILVTENGQSIRFHESNVRPMGRQAGGVNSIRLVGEDVVVGMDVVDDDDTHVLVITRDGYGKRTPVDFYRTQGRYGQGILTLARNEKTGPVVSMHCINAKDDILIITSGNVILRTSLEQIRETGRNAQGVKVIDLADSDVIVGVAVIDGAPETLGDATVDGASENGASGNGKVSDAQA